MDKPRNVPMESGPIAGGLAQEDLQKPSHRTVFILREGPWHRTEELITAISCHGRDHGGSDVPPTDLAAAARFDGCNAHAASKTDSVKEATEVVQASPQKSVAAVRAK